MVTLATITAYDVGTIKRVVPILYHVEIEAIYVVALEGVIGIKTHCLGFLCLLALLFLSQFSLQRHSACLLGECHYLLAQCMTPYIKQNIRINLIAIHHDGKHQVGTSLLTANNGDCLPCLHVVTALHQVLRIESIDGLQSVAMTYHNDIAVSGALARQSHRTAEHSLHGIALGRLYLYAALRLSHCLSHRQREGIFRVISTGEIYLESV